MKVLLTGAAGLIGMSVRDLLAQRGHQVTATDVTDFGRGDRGIHIVDLHDRPALEEIIARDGIEAIVHCGAISGPMMAKGQPLLLVKVNIDGTALLLDLARVHGMKRFVFCSSISVYGNVGLDVITEETPLRPTSVYGASKVACEQLIQGFAAEYGLEGISLRIGRVYGPYRRANCYLGSIIRDAAAGQTTEIPCDPAFAYHYVHADDVASAIAASLEATTLPAREYNVGAGEALTMPQIVDIARTVLPTASITMVPGADDVPDVQTRFAIDKFSRDFGWTPQFRLAEGLMAYQHAIESGRAAG
jgi:UDP-glucuronate 4-epimerase